MTNKLKIDTPNGQIKVEPGDTFYGVGKNSNSIFKLTPAYYGWAWQAREKVDWMDTPYEFLAKEVDFTRPAPDEDGWIKYYGTGQPVGDDVVVKLRFNDGDESIVGRADMWGWRDESITHYRIMQESSLPEPEGLQQTGTKHDHGKERLYKGLVEQFPNSCGMVAKLSEKGAEKYAWGNWRHVDVERYKDACARHLFAEDDVDDETGLSKWAHVAWNALAILEMECKDK